MNKSTPTPWKYHLGRGANPRFHIQTEGGYQIASTTELARHSQAHEENAMREANAAFIVKAVNAYEKDQEIKRELVGTLKGIRMTIEDNVMDKQRAVEVINKAIAKAEGK